MKVVLNNQIWEACGPLICWGREKYISGSHSQTTLKEGGELYFK